MVALAAAAVALAAGGCGETVSSAAERWRALRDSTIARTEVAAARIGANAYVVGARNTTLRWKASSTRSARAPTAASPWPSGACARRWPRFDLTEGQGLERAAEALAADRDQIRALDALVEIGSNTRIGVGEHELLALADRLVRGAFPRDELRVGLLDDGVLRRVGADGALEAWPGDDDRGERFALIVQGRPAGAIEIRRAGPLSERERSVLASLASQLATALENARLYVRLDGLFRSYLSPEVAASLLADPGRAALGGTVQEVTVLMADLRGFTPFSERSTPAEVVEMLNRLEGAAPAGGVLVGAAARANTRPA